MSGRRKKGGEGVVYRTENTWLVVAFLYLRCLTQKKKEVTISAISEETSVEYETVRNVVIRLEKLKIIFPVRYELIPSWKEPSGKLYQQVYLCPSRHRYELRKIFLWLEEKYKFLQAV